MWRRQADFDGAFYVALRLREADAREIYATRWSDDPEALALDAAAAVPGFVCGLERPIAAIGAVPMYPGVWNVWMFATDEFPRIGVSMTKLMKRVMIPNLQKIGGHRAECRSIEGHTEAHKWLELLGARREAEHLKAGKNGETFYTYAWVF